MTTPFKLEDRDEQDVLWGAPAAASVDDDAALWGPSPLDAPADPPQPQLPADRAPTLREFAGYGDRPVSIAETISSGDLGRFVEHLRDRARQVEPNSDEQKRMVANISRLREAETQFAKIQKTARRRGVSLSTAQQLEGDQRELFGVTEEEFVEGLGPILGPGFRAISTGLESATEAGISTAERVAFKAKGTGQELLIQAGFPDLVGDQISPVFVDPRRLARDSKKMQEFQDALDRDAGLQEVLGERGAAIFKGVAESVPKYMAAGTAGGPAAVYALLAAESHNRGLNTADDNGLTGFQREGFALASAGIEVATTFALGRLGERLGLTTLEEAASPGMRNAVRGMLTKRGVQDQVQKLYRGAAGAGLEGIEEGVIDASNQAAEFISGIDGSEDGFDWDRFLTSALAGVAGGGLANAVADIRSRVQLPEAELKEVIGGVVAAEEAVELATAPEGDTESETPPAAAAAEPSVRGALEAAEAAVRQPGASGRGARQARKFFERATPELIEKAQQPLSQKEFAELTGIKKTSQPFRDSFRETLDFYEPLLRAKTPKDPPRDISTDPDTGARESGEAAAGSTEAETRPEPLPPGQPTPEASTSPTSRAQPPTTRQSTEGTTSNPNRDRAIDLGRNMPLQALRSHEIRQALDADLTTPENVADNAIQILSEVVPAGPHLADLVVQAARVQSKKAASELMDKVDKEIRAHDHRLAMKEFRESLKDARNLRPEFADLVEDLRGGIDLSGPRTRKQLEAIKDFYDRNGIPPSTEDQKALEKLSQRHVNDMSPTDIRAAAEVIRSAAKQSQDVNRLLQSEFDEFVDDLEKRIVIDAASARKLRLTTAPSGLKGLLPAILRRESDDVSPRRPLLSTDSPVIREGFARPEDNMRPLETIRQLLWEDGFVQPNAQQKQYDRDELLELNQVFEENNLDAGGVSGFGVTITDSAMEQWRVQTAEIGNATITRDEALLIHLMFRDQELSRTMRANGVEFGRRDRKTGPITEELEQQIDEFVGTEGRNIATHMFTHFNGRIIDRVNAAWTTVNGHPLTRRQLHVPRPVDPTKLQKDKQSPFAQRLVDTTIESYGHLKKREGAGGAITIPDNMSGGIDHFLKHAQRMSRVAAYLVPYRNARTVLDRPNVRGAIESVGGPTLWESLNQSLEQQVAPPIFDPSDIHFEETQRVIRRATGKLKGSIVALSPTAMVLPIVGVITSASQEDGGFRRLPGAIAKSMIPSERRRAQQLAFEHSPVAWHRWRSGNFTGEITGGFLTDRSFFRPRGTLDTFSSLLMKAEQQIALPTRWFMAEDFVKSQGVDPGDPTFNDQVARQFERSMYRGENSSEPMEMSGALKFANKNGVAAPFVAFMNAASKQYSAGLRGVDLVREGVEQKNPAKVIQGVKVLSGVAAGFMVEGIIRELFSFEEVPGDYAERIARRTAVGTVSTVPVAGTLMERVVRKALDMKLYPDDGDLLTSNVRDIADGASDLALQIAEGWPESDKDKEAFARDLWDVAKAFQFAGVPVSGIQQGVRRATTAAEEGVEGVLPGLDREGN